MTKELKLLENLKALTHFTPYVGANALQATAETVQIGAPIYDGEDYTAEVDALLATMATGNADVLAARQSFGAAIAEPIQQLIPYVEQFDRFFMPQTIGDTEDNLVAVEDITNSAYQSHPRSEIIFNEPGYRYTRPSWSTFQTGFKISWNTLRFSGWNILARQMNYTAWELAKKRDTAAKAVVDAAIPTNHKLTVTGGLTKAAIDEVIRRSNQIGFPVKGVIINPGRLMEMQGWTWGATGFFIPQNVAQELLDNLWYGNYGQLKWYASPHAPYSTVYLYGDASQIGWHQRKGSPRNDTQVDVLQGEDDYMYRDSYHAWYIQTGLALWDITIV